MMLKTSIDELTVVLQATVSEKMTLESNTDWQKLAVQIIADFEKNANLLDTFGSQVEEKNCPNGYNNGFTYGEHAFYFCVAYNDSNYSMGVVCKFSAQALAYYLKVRKIQVYEFLQSLNSEVYEFRLSRCDLDVDFLNESFTPTRIFEDLKRKKVVAYYQKKHKNKLVFVKKHFKLQGFAVGEEVPTLYCGAVSSDCQLRIYDKKREQIEKNGSKLSYVMKYNTVVRFELALKHDLAHNLTGMLLKIDSEKQLSNLILSIFLQKFYFKRVKTDRPTLYTKEMEKALEDNQSYLLGHLNSDNDILRRFQYLLFESGTISTLYKVLAVWGFADLNQALDFIKNFVQNWHANDDCKAWLKKHASDTAETFSSFAELKEQLQDN